MTWKLFWAGFIELNVDNNDLHLYNWINSVEFLNNEWRTLADIYTADLM